MHRSHRSRSESGLQGALDAVVGAFAGWTIGYQVGFALTLPAFVDAALGLVTAVVALTLVLRWRRNEPFPSDGVSGVGLALAAVMSAAIALAVLSTLMSRPDADDITLFHRAAVQLSHLGEPILTSDTTSDVVGLPGPPVGYLLTSYEFLVALVARGLGLDPLSTYQNAAGAVGSALVPPVYYLLFRRLGLRPLVAASAVGGVVAFLLLDGNDHRSMGNLAFVRLWQGKAVLLTLFPPYALTHILSFLERRERHSWLCVAGAGVSATGLSIVGCFFAPAFIVVAVLSVGGGLVLAKRLDWRGFISSGLQLMLATAYPLLVLAAILIAPFAGTVSPLEVDSVVSGDSAGRMTHARSGTSWSELLLLPPSSVARMAWALGIVVLAPLLALPRRRALVVALFAPVFILLVANPVAGRLLYGAVPDVFWRFYYLLPVPLAFGLLVGALLQVARSPHVTRWSATRAVTAAALLAFFGATVGMPVFSPQNYGFSWKSPSAWKLDPVVVGSLGPSLPELTGRTLLAEEHAAVALALIDPSIRVVVQRPQNTLQAFALAGRSEEGSARARAQGIVTGSPASVSGLSVFSATLRDVSAVVARSAAAETIEPTLAASGSTWHRIRADDVYTIYVRSRSP